MASSGVSHVSSVGAVAAGVLSYAKWHSFWWLLLHAFFGWFYVIYYWVQYGTK